MNVKVIGIVAALGAASVLVPRLGVADPAVDPARIWKRQCQSCHGADGSGNAAMATGTLKIEPTKLNLGRPEAASITRDQKQQTLLKGKDKMPAYEAKLKPAEVQPVLDYTQQLTDALRKK